MYDFSFVLLLVENSVENMPWYQILNNKIIL